MKNNFKTFADVVCYN